MEESVHVCSLPKKISRFRYASLDMTGKFDAEWIVEDLRKL